MIASVTMEDISKALDKFAQSKVPITVADVKKRLSEQLHGEEESFLGDEGHDVPPHRPGHDLSIPLENPPRGTACRHGCLGCGRRPRRRRFWLPRGWGR